jgi:hypothetical protein
MFGSILIIFYAISNIIASVGTSHGWNEHTLWLFYLASYVKTIIVYVLIPINQIILLKFGCDLLNACLNGSENV